ncbi:cation-translocating P-type ATPase [Streptomyces sp. ISL-99]|uniref:heavy metal translocating P-type ATPase n=1 Tax=Streptomyces sp. ISL-99 TaxID=2819193 RepID=UPI001BEA1200|nr:cation-translocating P-type ATPase [Streptomyces sp. ISL-99]MBT2525625.1 cation-translocating P-type ATPase [Streptomyces sp. ISL-99]
MTAVIDRTPDWAAEPSSLPGHSRVRARIAGLHCSLCTGTIEKALGRQPGVAQVAVSLTHEQALVDYDPEKISGAEILSTLRDIGYDLYDPRKLRPFEEEEAVLVREGVRLLAAVAASLTAIALVAAAGLVGALVSASVVTLMVPVALAILRPAGWLRASAGTLGIVAPGGAALALRATGVLGESATGWITGALAMVMMAVVTPHFARMAFQSARRGILNQHVLLEVGALAGIAGGVIGLTGVLPDYPTAAFFAVTVLITTYHTFSEWLSLLVKTRSSQAVKKLLDLRPDTARVVRDGTETELALEQIVVGDVVRIRPGERVPVDGRVSAGYSALDMSMVTGEPVPVERAPGEEVVGGSVNGTGTLLVEVARVGEETFLSQIVRHVEDARALKPGILHLVDRVLRLYTPLVLAASALALVAWLAGTALAGDVDARRAIFAALTVLVMGYPCAVGIAAPLAIVRGAGEAADHGILMRTGEAFQTLRQVRTMVLDKTGTLTAGKPTVRGIRAQGIDEDELLTLAAAAEHSSEHPLARAVVNAANDRGLVWPEAGDFTSLTGLGVAAEVAGRRVLVGRPALLAEQGIDITPLQVAIEPWTSTGHTAIAVAVDDTPVGVIALGDTLRPESADTVSALRAAGITPVLLTGDNHRAAAHTASQIGISEVHAEVRPDHKAAIIRHLQEGGHRVAMVGDGINDAPALMQADVGIAIGTGTDIAMESADIILVRDHLHLLLTAHRISRTSYRKVKQNVALAFTFNGIGIPAAATGLVYPVWAMIAMAASVTAIFANSIGARPTLLFAAISSVGRQEGTAERATNEPEHAAA